MRRSVPALILAVLAACFVISGCGSSGDGLGKKDVETASKADQIIKASGGKWENLSPADKEYLVREIGYGNENNAKMFFNAKAGNLKGRPMGTPGGPGRLGGPARN